MFTVLCITRTIHFVSLDNSPSHQNIVKMFSIVDFCVLSPYLTFRPESRKRAVSQDFLEKRCFTLVFHLLEDVL